MTLRQTGEGSASPAFRSRFSISLRFRSSEWTNVARFPRHEAFLRTKGRFVLDSYRSRIDYHRSISRSRLCSYVSNQRRERLAGHREFRGTEGERDVTLLALRHIRSSSASPSKRLSTVSSHGYVTIAIVSGFLSRALTTRVGDALGPYLYSARKRAEARGLLSSRSEPEGIVRARPDPGMLPNKR